MKKTTTLLLTLLLMILTACSSMPNANPSLDNNSSAPSPDELPETTRLILGTLKLEDTNQPVSAEQAATLLPLWQTMQVLSESETAAQQEMDALVAQIQETMTVEQMQAITDMNLTRADLMNIMQEQGLAMGPAGGQNNNAQGENPNGGGGAGPGGSGFPGGAPPQGGFPGAPGGGGQGSELSPDQIATLQASRQAGGGDRISPMLINAVIQYLQERAGS